MERATAPEARTRPLEQLSGVLRMMFAVASVKRAETAFPGLHGAVEVVTRGRHVEQLSGREHLAAAAKEASKQLKREQQQEPEPEPALEWNPWDPADPMNLGMGGSQGYGLGL